MIGFRKPNSWQLAHFDIAAPVVQKLDSATHRINLYPVDNAIGFPNTYPLDSKLIQWIALSNFWTTGAWWVRTAVKSVELEQELETGTGIATQWVEDGVELCVVARVVFRVLLNMAWYSVRVSESQQLNPI